MLRPLSSSFDSAAQKVGNQNMGIALNQMIVLNHFYEKEISEKSLRASCAKRDIHPDYYLQMDEYSTAEPAIASYRGLTKKQVYWATMRLKHRGYIKHATHTDSGHKDEHISEKGRQAVEESFLIKSGPLRPHTGIRNPPKNTISQYAWQVLRTKSTATAEEIANMMPELDDYAKTLGTIRRLLGWWTKAKIIRRMQIREQGTHYNSRGKVRYQLQINLGPQHPIIRQRKHEIYDPNTRVNVHFKEVLSSF